MNGNENALVTSNAQGSALVQAESQRAVAEVQAAMILARQFPRDEKRAIDKMLVAFQRPALAEQSLYSYNRGGSDVTGPSIRAAEAIAQNWGNLQFGVRELSQTNGESTVEAFAWDIETNVRQVKVFQVPHTRYTRKNGNVKLSDPRDIYELVANQGARRLRACILGVIPGDVVESVVTQTEETLKARADTSPEALKKMLELFEVYGVSKGMIEKRIQRNLDAITPAQVVHMRKIYNSLKDGMSKPADWFEDIKEPANTATAEDIMNRLKEEPKSEDILQACYAALDELSRLNGESPDDIINGLTKGKVSCQIDLQDKSAAYINDITVTVKTLIEKEKGVKP